VEKGVERRARLWLGEGEEDPYRPGAFPRCPGQESVFLSGGGYFALEFSWGRGDVLSEKHIFWTLRASFYESSLWRGGGETSAYGSLPLFWKKQELKRPRAPSFSCGQPLLPVGGKALDLRYLPCSLTGRRERSL